METLSGYVEKIVYRNAENGYTVLSLSADKEEITCVGNFVFVNEGEFLKVEGEYTEHAVYGEQFRVSSYEQCAPSDEQAILKYLSSGAVKGIGEALAGRIIKKFGADTFRIMEEEPERLAEVKGISERKAMEIYRQFYEKREMREAMVFLQQYDISTGLAVKIYNFYGPRMYDILQKNPYKLAEDVYGVGFRTADEIAQKAGIVGDSEYRIRAGILYVLTFSYGNGHCFLPQNVLLEQCEQLLEVSKQKIEPVLEELSTQRKVIVQAAQDEPRVYSPTMYYMELNTARMLLDLAQSCHPDDKLMAGRIERLQKSFCIKLDEKQRLAVEEATKNGLFILTGGPGTGKTTTINALIRYFEAEGMEVLLTAPTGRAAKRMSEATGKESRTIHRLLEISHNPELPGSEMRFERNEEKPLETDVLIVDEVSMVDLPLLHALLKAVPVGTRLILVGDENQLPSVGPGNVLHDILKSGLIPSVRLTKIFRQGEESHIVVNAHKINRGEQLDFENKYDDFFLLRRNTSADILGLTIALVRDKIPAYIRCSPMDIQVLTPMRKGELGVENLNRILQHYLNPADKSKGERKAHGFVFREGDKVMQIKNNYQLEWEITDKRGYPLQTGAGVFNGDIGILKEINTYDECAVVEFDDGRTARYGYGDMEELEPAYAVTIHKSQGSEYPAVVIPILSGPRQLFHRNILYTAVTRAKQCVALVGSEQTIQGMIENVKETERYTSLAEKLSEM